MKRKGHKAKLPLANRALLVSGEGNGPATARQGALARPVQPRQGRRGRMARAEQDQRQKLVGLHRAGAVLAPT